MEALTALLRAEADPWNGMVMAAYACANCRGINVAYESVRRNAGREVDYSDATTYPWAWGSAWLPSETAQDSFPDVPPDIAGAASEATLCASVGAYRAVGSLARAVLEATAKDLGITQRSLQAKIDELASQDYIRDLVKEQAHEIRHFGNDMAHGDFANPVEEDEAREIIGLMREVLREVYQAPAELGRLRARREGDGDITASGELEAP